MLRIGKIASLVVLCACGNNEIIIHDNPPAPDVHSIVVGRVTDAQGNPVDSVIVTLRAEPARGPTGVLADYRGVNVMTDREGKFTTVFARVDPRSFTRPSPDTVTVTAVVVLGLRHPHLRPDSVTTLVEFVPVAVAPKQKSLDIRLGGR